MNLITVGLHLLTAWHMLSDLRPPQTSPAIISILSIWEWRLRDIHLLAQVFTAGLSACSGPALHTNGRRAVPRLFSGLDPAKLLSCDLGLLHASAPLFFNPSDRAEVSFLLESFYPWVPPFEASSPHSDENNRSQSQQLTINATDQKHFWVIQSCTFSQHFTLLFRTQRNKDLGAIST